jgi:DNA-binding NarL/FixJ family response regulator
MNIVLFSDDLALVTYWQKAITLKSELIESMDALKNIKSSVIIMNVSSCFPECLELVQHLKIQENKVLVLHRMPTLATAKKFLKNGADGYGNAMMKEHFLHSALYTIEDDMVWLHPEITSAMITELPASKTQNSHLLDDLTAREKEVANLLKNGDTYKKVAEALDITPRTVKAHAGHIYTKLNIKDRLALALLLK